MTVALLLAKRPCTECLLSKNRIVPGSAAADYVTKCRDSHTHFICHKGSISGQIVHCRAFHDKYGSQAHDFAVAFDIPIVEVDADQLMEDALSQEEIP